MKCINFFLQSTDNARQGDEKPKASVAAKAEKLLANSSYVYQAMHYSHHFVTKC